MLKVKVITIGKTKEQWLSEAIKEYEKRLKSYVSFQWVFAKNNNILFDLIEKKNFIALDVNGTEFNSLEFSKKIFYFFELFHSEIIFIIGGADGIPQKILSLAKQVFSFSKLTFTHQMTRLVLIEQIYRSHQIEHGNKNYHK